MRLCGKTTNQISWSTQTINTEISIYVYVGYVNVDISGSVLVGICLSYPPISKPNATCNADLTLSFYMRVSGDASTTLLVRM